MYTQHFGLKKAVFDGGIAQGDDLYLGPQQQRAAANLKIGLTTRDSIVTLTGCLGVGKTTIASEALRITATRLAQTWVGNTPLAPDEMLELLLAGFEFTPYDMGRVQRLHTWRQFMGELSVTDTRICILVENAFALGVEALQSLEALTAADPNDCPGANLVLMGPTSLDELLETPELAPLKQRIRSNQRLDPLTPQEVEQYLRHRITAVGGDYDTMFTPATAAMIHCFSAGVPRVINNVCETALVVAATRRTTQLTPQIVQRVAEGVYGLAPSVELPEVAVAVAPVAAASPVAAAEQPDPAPVPPADPAPVAAASPAAVEQQAAAPVSPADPEPVAAARPVAAAEQPAQASVPPADPAPVDDVQALFNAEVLVDDAEAPIDVGEARVDVAAAEPQQPPSVADTTGAVQDSPAPLADPVPVDDFQALFDAQLLADDAEAPIGGAEARVDAAAAEPQQVPAVAETTGAAQHPPEPPVLTDEFVIGLPGDGENVARDAQPSVATLPPESTAQPDAEPQSEPEDVEDLASATHLHEISDRMAELLFSEEQALMAAGLLEEDAPLESGDVAKPVERTAVVLQLDEDSEPEPEAPAPAAHTVVF